MHETLWQPALAQHRFDSDDLDEVREYMDGHNGAHWRHARRPGPLGFGFWYRESAIVRLAGCAMEATQTVRGGVGTATVHVTLAGRSAYRIGRREIASFAGDIVVLPAGREMTIEARGLRRLAIQLPPRDVEGEAAARGRTLSSSALAALRRALDAISLAQGGPALAHAEARLADWSREVLAAPVEGRRRTGLAEIRVRRIEDWIDAHVSEPLSLARLCEEAGVGARCLQLAFEAKRQQSPMSFVTERRLVAAHGALARGEFGSVTAVASAFGFEHPGRFAAAFRRLYGLSPSEMIRRVAAAR